MNFSAVTERITTFLDGRQLRWAIVGGVGLAAYGLARTTLDLDFAVETGSQEPLVAFLENDGYRTVHRSRGYSNHLHADPERGRVDFVYVEGETAEKLFAACRLVPGPGGLMIRVASPEHLAAMKVQAMKNDPERTFQDLSDLRFLLGLPGVDRAEVRQYFERQGLSDRYEEISRTL